MLKTLQKCGLSFICGCIYTRTRLMRISIREQRCKGIVYVI
ncbi:hypothetical protein M5D96_011812 [Drosophila gunungcola]|uniref:Uncharacterized protein n=1 Tax=Drosophila gunungcola TaxID=103775 RepID=A0A9P9YF15_9MUSC|nr:hypothetical protein M5D96_011812 [Drosophila gunungcola]